MGRSLFWLVIECPDADGIAAELDVKRTGRAGASSDFALMSCTLSEGRVLLVSKHFDEPLFTGKRLAKLSQRGRIVATRMEEHVMASSCEAWASGRKIWSITHDSEKSPRHLAMIGKIPKDLAPLRQAAFDAQDREDSTDPEVDHVFDVPLHFARAQTGLDVEEDFGVAPNAFQELDIGFWKRTWRSTFWWRLAFGLAGGLYLAGWIARKLGWQ